MSSLLDKNQNPNRSDGSPEAPGRFWSSIVAACLGTAFEYIDFALFGLASALVFTKIFFPAQTPLVGLLASFATYAVGFVARPVGAFVFGRVGDRYGRKVVLVTTIALMGAATTGIGVIPGYAQIGVWAPALLVGLRLLQGFGAGAELSGGAVVLAELAPTARRGLVASLVGVGSNTGTLLASLAWLAVLRLPEREVLSWGWRVPFLASAIIVVFALLLRSGMGESPVYTAVRAARAEQQATAEKRSGMRAFFIMLGLRIGENGPSYLAQGFLVGYVVHLGAAKTIPTRAVLIASVLGFAVIPLAGWLSDRFGRRVTYRAFCGLLVVYAFPAFWLLQGANPVVVTAVIVVGMCLASLGIFGVQAAYGVELFGAGNRYTKMAIAKELGSILSGGTAPMVASALLAATGQWTALAGYFMVMAAIGLATTFVAPETRGRDLTAMEDAV